VTALGLSIALAIIATIAHEIGHLVCALTTGAHVKAVRLSWVGLSLRTCVDPPCQWRVQVNYLSGPLMNLMLAGMCWNLWYTFAWMNLLTAVFNLVLPRSDGWQAWQA
jgi:hypothetical protein